MTQTAEEIYSKIKSDLNDEQIDQMMLAARVAANVMLATEADNHIEQCMEGPLPPPYMCFVRGIELGFILGASTAIGGVAEEQFGSQAVDVKLIFADLRKRMEQRATEGPAPTATVEVPVEKKLILPS